MSIDNFGPAFPVSPESAERLGCVFTHEDVGLTKRDWFAGMALIGFIADPGDKDDPETWEEVLKRIPRAVYEIADAMLEQRKC
jgi:hypothetical protein